MLVALLHMTASLPPSILKIARQPFALSADVKWLSDVGNPKYSNCGMFGRRRLPPLGF